MNGMVLMFFVTTLDFCLPSTGHLWPHWHHWPKLFHSISCFPWQHCIVTLSPDVSQYFVACAFILSYLRNPHLDTWTANFSIAIMSSRHTSCLMSPACASATRSPSPKACGNVHYFHKLVILEECVAFDLAILGTSLQVSKFQDHFGQAFFSLQPCCKPNIPWLSHLEAEQKIYLQSFRVLSLVLRIFVFVSILEETFTNSDLEDGIKSCRLLAMHVSCPFLHRST